MTDAIATITAAIITSVITALTTFLGILVSKDKLRLPKIGVFIYIFAGLVFGAVIGLIIGFVLLRRPQPLARISAPAAGQPVPVNALVKVNYSNIPDDRHLWIAVRIPGIGPRWLIYPQLPDAASVGAGSGVFTVMAGFGGAKDSGHPFNIVVLLADENANRSFVDYANACSLDSNLCGGMILPDTGVEILDFDTVVRQ